jgi:hypothetical protein
MAHYILCIEVLENNGDITANPRCTIIARSIPNQVLIGNWHNRRVIQSTTMCQIESLVDRNPISFSVNDTQVLLTPSATPNAQGLSQDTREDILEY